MLVLGSNSFKGPVAIVWGFSFLGGDGIDEYFLSPSSSVNSEEDSPSPLKYAYDLAMAFRASYACRRVDRRRVRIGVELAGPFVAV